MNDEVEDFEITEDDWNAATGSGERRRRGLSKHQQIYGVWAADEASGSDDEVENGKGFILGTHAKATKRVFSSKGSGASVSFVSGGIKQGDKISKQEPTVETVGSSDEEPEVLQLSRKNKSSKTKQTSTYHQMLAGMRGGRGTDPAKFGDFEKHTRGIGAKLLGKMGYKVGKGLGKEGKGIVEPIPAAKRPGRGAVGAYGPEASRPKDEIKRDSKKGQIAEESDEDDADSVAITEAWKKDGNRKKPKYRYKTIEEVIAQGGEFSKRMGVGQTISTKVIDMTGREQKVYQGYDAFSAKTRKPQDSTAVDVALIEQKSFDIPELTFNINLLVDMTEEEIIRSDRQLKRMKDENVALQHEELTLTQTIEGQEREVSRLEKLLKHIDEFNEKSRSGSLTLDECREFFELLQSEFYEEYKTNNLAVIANSVVLPLIKQNFASWEPLSQPDYGYALMKTWHDLLEEGRSWATVTSLEQMEPFHRIIWEAWMPYFRRTVQTWQVRDFEKMISLLEHWLPLMPKWILDNILDLIILPKLQTEVENWDPLSDTIPLHSWLHPWLPLMGDRLQPVYGPIRHKLGSALQQWHPSDLSAKLILKPWKGVFSKGSMESFLARHIVPKLDLCLQTFLINPALQKLEPWRWVMDWLDMVGVHVIATQLLRHFFPKWQEALATWLSSVSANYVEITNWYSGWKSMFAEELLAVPLIKEQFTYALTLMNRAASGGPAAFARLPPPGPPSYAPPPPPPPLTAAQRSNLEALGARASNVSVPSSFKDLIERKAEENGIPFLPVPNRTIEGKPVYRFGPATIYLDRSVIFMQTYSSQSYHGDTDRCVVIAMEDNEVFESLVEWLKTFELSKPEVSASSLTTGVQVAEVLTNIDTSVFNTEWLSRLQLDLEESSNWRIRASNMKKIIKSVRDYYNEELHLSISHLPIPDANKIAEFADVKELGRLLQLILGIGVYCKNKQVHVQQIMGLEENVQLVIKHLIEDLQGRERSKSSFVELNPQEEYSKALEEIQRLKIASAEQTRKYVELEHQVITLREENSALKQQQRVLHPDEPQERKLSGRSSESHDVNDVDSAANKKITQLQHQVEELQEELYKMEATKEAQRLKAEKLEREYREQMAKLEEVKSREQDFQRLKDEVDELRVKADEARKLQTSLATYKKRLEEMGDLKSQMKVLEGKNTSLITSAIELEEEQRKTSALRQQLEAYKAEIAEGQTLLAEQTRRSDRAEFELKKAQERMEVLNEERSRFAEEVQFLHDKFEENQFTVLKPRNDTLTEAFAFRNDALSATQQSLQLSWPPECREQILRLEHDNKRLRESVDTAAGEQTALLKSQLENANERKRTLEEELRSANGRVIELESQVNDLSPRSGDSNNGAKTILDLPTSIEAQKLRLRIIDSEKLVQEKDQKLAEILTKLAAKESELTSQEAKFKASMERALTVIHGLEQKTSTLTTPRESQGTSNERQASLLAEETLRKENSDLKLKLQKINEDQERMQMLKEQEERLITTAFHNMALQVFRRTSSDRLAAASGRDDIAGGGNSFLERQRQLVTPRRPIVSSSSAGSSHQHALSSSALRSNNLTPPPEGIEA